MYPVQGPAYLLGVSHSLQRPLLRQLPVPAQAHEVLDVVLIVVPQLQLDAPPVRAEADLLTDGVYPDLKTVSHGPPPYAGEALFTTASTCSRKVTHSSFRASRAFRPLRVMR